MIRDESPSGAVDRLAERNARLVVRLQRTAEAYHRASGHAAHRWIDCSDAICLMAFRVIRRNEG